MQNLHITTCKKCTLLSHLYGEMWCVQILHIPHFDKCYYYGECQKLCNKTQFLRAVLLFLHPFPYLCPCFGRSLRDIYAALGKRFFVMSWIFLIAAGLCETAFTFCLGKAKISTDAQWWAWISAFCLLHVLSAVLLAKAVLQRARVILENLFLHHAYCLGGRAQKCGIVAQKCVNIFFADNKQIVYFCKKEQYA